MKFTFTTKYDKKAMEALAKGLRKTTRGKREKRSRIFGIIIGALGLWLLWKNNFALTLNNVITGLCVLVLLTPNLWEDKLNGYIGRKRLMNGLSSSVTTFDEEDYRSVTEIGESIFLYDKVTALAEMEEYFVFLFDKNHGQVYDKSSLSGGTGEQFREFIQHKTGKTIMNIK